MSNLERNRTQNTSEIKPSFPFNREAIRKNNGKITSGLMAFSLGFLLFTHQPTRMLKDPVSIPEGKMLIDATDGFNTWRIDVTNTYYGIPQVPFCDTTVSNVEGSVLTNSQGVETDKDVYFRSTPFPEKVVKGVSESHIKLGNGNIVIYKSPITGDCLVSTGGTIIIYSNNASRTIENYASSIYK